MPLPSLPEDLIFPRQTAAGSLFREFIRDFAFALCMDKLREFIRGCFAAMLLQKLP